MTYELRIGTYELKSLVLSFKFSTLNSHFLILNF
jgi:hypothetical protein